jgi:hypothetical protein
LYAFPTPEGTSVHRHFKMFILPSLNTYCTTFHTPSWLDEGEINTNITHVMYIIKIFKFVQFFVNHPVYIFLVIDQLEAQFLL